MFSGMIKFMHEIINLLQTIHNPEMIIRWGGYTIIAIIIFAETGLFIGFFLPGDSLLVTAGLLASQNYLNIYELLFIASLMAIVGDSVGYNFGKITGPKIFKKDKSLLFAKKHLVQAEEFYKKHGKKTIVLARFVPVVRTFAPIVAGMGKMSYMEFITFNILGGILWVGTMSMIGFFLGRIIPNAKSYLHWIIIGVIFISILPAIIAWIKNKIKQK